MEYRSEARQLRHSRSDPASGSRENGTYMREHRLTGGSGMIIIKLAQHRSLIGVPALIEIPCMRQWPLPSWVLIAYALLPIIINERHALRSSMFLKAQAHILLIAASCSGKTESGYKGKRKNAVTLTKTGKYLYPAPRSPVKRMRGNRSDTLIPSNVR